jgi:oligopeptide transport system ATP-binding protein
MRDASTPVLAVESLSKSFRARRHLRAPVTQVHAVRDVSFSLQVGASLGIVGESGSGKTTIARMLAGLETPTAGRIVLNREVLADGPRQIRRSNRTTGLQLVFQDPYTSLDPCQTVRAMLEEIDRVHFGRPAPARTARAHELLDAVGLSTKHARALPRELSGGERQRAALARALATDPNVIVLDEAVSALDVSIQGQILNLLADVRSSLNLALILISHDLAVVRQVSDDVLVMYRGRVVERGPVEQVVSDPLHPYTQSLLDAVPRPGMPLQRRPAVLDDEDGCPFRQRCPHAHERCLVEPPLIDVELDRAARCWLVEEGPVHPGTDGGLLSRPA